MLVYYLVHFEDRQFLSLQNPMNNQKFIFISILKQQLVCYTEDTIWRTYSISTAKNGVGERHGSECTPRGWHKVHSIIGTETPINSVFVARVWTNEIYSPELASAHPHRDWILTRVIQLDGMEPGRNKGKDVDSLQRHIYIHGTPDTINLTPPGSHGCVRMRNNDLIELATWATIGMSVCIE